MIIINNNNNNNNNKQILTYNRITKIKICITKLDSVKVKYFTHIFFA